MIIVIDNYDSFTYNLVQHLGELGAECKVFRNDEVSVDEIVKLNPTRIIISPGPGTPDEAGISAEVITRFYTQIPILGVCLGHQTIGQIFGAKIVRANELMHGKVSEIFFQQGTLLFQGISNPFTATRYHSLIINRVSLEKSPLKITAWTADNVVMAISHRECPSLVGVQFHPESVLTDCGKKILTNFLEF